MIKGININHFAKIARYANSLCKTSFQYPITNVLPQMPLFSRTDTKDVIQLPIVKRFYSNENQVGSTFAVDYNYVKEAVSNKNTLIIDVREPEELKEHGQIPNSINIPLGVVSTALGSMSDEDFQKTYKKAKPTEDTEIIFYCMIGKRSGQAQQNTINLGYKNVKNYLGSWTDWASKV